MAMSNTARASEWRSIQLLFWLLLPTSSADRRGKKEKRETEKRETRLNGQPTDQD